MEPKKYVKKPIPVEAAQWDGSQMRLEELQAWARDEQTKVACFRRSPRPYNLTVGDTVQHWDAEVYDVKHRTWIPLKQGDWVIKGTAGEFYPHEGALFSENYEEADPNA